MAPRVLTMRWERLAFLHWPVDPSPLRERIPETLELDTFDGAAWVGVVPFQMRRTRLRFLPPFPGTHSFHELNLRTYVTHRSRPGVWFFSLDADSWLSIRAARLTFALPYLDARMAAENDGAGGLEFTSERTHRGAPAAGFHARYRPIGDPAPGRPGTLEHFLTERYSLYAERGWGVDRALRGGLVRGDIEHAPWPLQRAECEVERCDMFALGGAAPPADERLRPPVAHYAHRIDVLARAPVRVEQASPRPVHGQGPGPALRPGSPF